MTTFILIYKVKNEDIYFTNIKTLQFSFFTINHATHKLHLFYFVAALDKKYIEIDKNLKCTNLSSYVVTFITSSARHRYKQSTPSSLFLYQFLPSFKN